MGLSKFTFVFLLLSFALGGCSTMFNSGSQTIVATTTNGKEVKVKITTPSGSYLGKIPSTIVAEPSSFHNVSIEVIDDCYDKSAVFVNSRVTPSYWANLLNYIGLFIDPLTGAMWKYDNQVTVQVTEITEKVGCNSN